MLSGHIPQSGALRTSNSAPTRRRTREQAYQATTHWAVAWPLFPCSLSTKTPSGDLTGASTGTAGAMVNMSMVVDDEITDECVCGLSLPERGLFIPPALKHGRQTLSVYPAHTYVALNDKLTTNATNCVRTRGIFGSLGLSPPNLPSIPRRWWLKRHRAGSQPVTYCRFHCLNRTNRRRPATLQLRCSCRGHRRASQASVGHHPSPQTAKRPLSLNCKPESSTRW
ncbi:hypothetical protein K466DRAFT_217827 [Polyporus arcularius HHB13444]|uniref:Uncharacterized protein n=1 Tax=Polyporus arcularius HHB13444 TaxID=1314778 RepID=A0A5C3PSF9_9APHY|nr:hypothetical protein K466DRAFT_217827 [Polyporus arcularius HHB13444]